MLYIHIFFAISPFFTLTIPAFLDVVQAPVDYWKCVIPFAGMCQTPAMCLCVCRCILWLALLSFVVLYTSLQWSDTVFDIQGRCLEWCCLKKKEWHLNALSENADTYIRWKKKSNFLCWGRKAQLDSGAKMIKEKFKLEMCSDLTFSGYIKIH